MTLVFVRTSEDFGEKEEVNRLLNGTRTARVRILELPGERGWEWGRLGVARVEVVNMLRLLAGVRGEQAGRGEDRRTRGRETSRQRAGGSDADDKLS